MGCDIHAFVEIRRDGEWQWHNWESKYQDGIYDDGEPKYDYRSMRDDPLDIGRSYDLFAQLANVRNGSGFAGCDTGDGFYPISEPRGLPEDVSNEVKAELEKWGADAHSTSWHTIQSLLDYDTSRTTTRRGWVEEDVYRDWVENKNREGFPKSMSGGVFGGSIVHASNAEMDRLLSGETEREPGKSYYTEIVFPVTYLDCAKRFWETTVPALAELGDPGDVRLVFWFDN